MLRDSTSLPLIQAGRRSATMQQHMDSLVFTENPTIVRGTGLATTGMHGVAPHIPERAKFLSTDAWQRTRAEELTANESRTRFAIASSQKKVRGCGH